MYRQATRRIVYAIAIPPLVGLAYYVIGRFLEPAPGSISYYIMVGFVMLEVVQKLIWAAMKAWDRAEGRD